MNEIIKVSNLSKHYLISERKNGFLGFIANIFIPKFKTKEAVSGISFSINQGEAVGFIGANGAGKSTTIKMLSGILHPSSGSIIVDGYIPYKQRRKYVANIGVVLGQKSQLTWDLPVIDSYELIRYIYKIPKRKYEENLNKFMDLLDMKEFIGQPVRQLSLGQRMRAEIVAAMLHSPKIIFLDEPTIGLDVVAKQKIQDFIKKTNKEFGVTIIFTTHDLQDIEKTCERLIVIDKGKKIYDGSVNGIRTIYGRQHKLIVEFEDAFPDRDKYLLSIESVEDKRASFVLYDTDFQLGKLKKYLYENYKVKSINENSEKIEFLDVEFKEKYDFKSSYFMDVEKKGDYQYLFKIKNINMQLSDLIHILMREYKVKDIVIKEPDISEIVCDIYEGRISIK